MGRADTAAQNRSTLHKELTSLPDMAYVSKALLGRALEALRGQHALVLFTVPAMTRADVPTAGSPAQAEQDAVEFRGAQEKALMDEFFKVDGADHARPYFQPGAGDWVAARYPAGTTLQRQRTDRAKSANPLFYRPDGTRWALVTDIADRIAADTQLLPRGPIPLVALGAWMYRNRSVENVQELVDLVVDELKLNRDGLIGKVYSADVGAIDTTSAFEDGPISPEALLDFLKAPAAPAPAAPLGTIAEVVERIEEAMGRAGVALAPGFVGRVVRAWLNRDIAMLVGAPGTGKSTFAREFGNACELEIPDQRETKVVLVDPDFDAARLLGYLDLAGKFRASEFTKEVLQTGQPLVPRVVIFEECNTAQLEAYAGQLLHAVESAGGVQLPDDSEPRLPLDVLLLATGNSVRDEPETRLPISRPSKRRMTIIEMPNILYEAWRDGKRAALVEQANLYLEYERTRLDQRSEDPPLLDELRAPRLQAVKTLEELDEDVRNLLLDLVEYLFGTDDGQNLMTIGLLVDILRDVIYADEESAAEALGWQVTGKLLEQVSSMDVARGLAERCAALPNAEAITRAVARMDLKDGSVSPLL